MISSIAWVPAGVADPAPKRYEMSSTEQELVQMLQDKGSLTDKPKKGSMAVKMPDAPPVVENNLPADLRMDEYSSDEDEGVALGNLLADKSLPITEDMVPESEDEDEEEEAESDEEKAKGANDAIDSDDVVSEEEDSDDDDDLADVPDTREYTPIDVEGLQAMGLSHVSTNGAMNLNDLGDGEDDGSEAEDVRLTADDALIVVAKTEDVSNHVTLYTKASERQCCERECMLPRLLLTLIILFVQEFASLEVHVYNTRKGHLYIHHDIPLPSFPLCLAHGQVSSSGTVGNFCAVGTFSPGIEIWNLDVLNALEPSCVLGGEDTTIADELLKQHMMSEATGQKPEKATHNPSSGGLKPGSHTDAIMALSWNQIHRQVVASGSADCTVKLWDVTHAGLDANGKCNAGTFSHHKDKVQSVVWHPKEATLLATGSYDRTVALLDARGGGKNVKSVKISGDCESLAWDPCNPEYLTVATEDGTLSCWDVRMFQTSKPLWSFVANEFGGVSDLSYNSLVPGMLATCSTDKTLTLWDTCSQDGIPTAGVAPRPCGNKDMCSGKLYTVAFYPSTPWLVGTAGSGNQLALWDLWNETTLKERFEGRMKSKEEVVETPAPTPTEAEPVPEQKDFDAMMSSNDDEATDADKDTSAGKKKKGKAKGKKKSPHKR